MGSIDFILSESPSFIARRCPTAGQRPSIMVYLALELARSSEWVILAA